MRFVELSIVVKRGNLIGAYEDSEDAEMVADSVIEDLDDDVYDTEEDDAEYDEDSEEVYWDTVVIDRQDLGKTCETIEGDCFSGVQIIEAFKHPEVKAPSAEEDADDDTEIDLDEVFGPDDEEDYDFDDDGLYDEDPEDFDGVDVDSEDENN